MKALLSTFFLAVLAGGLFENSQDIGITSKPGSAEYNPGTHGYRVTGGGANIGAQTDTFHFAYKKISGDFTLTADVHFIGQGVEPQRKLALMVRQSLAPESSYADVAVQGDGSTVLQYRPSAGVDTSEFRAAMKAPTHISITRHGHEFSISASDVGVQPATTGPVIVSMQDPVYVGLAVCSHTAGVLETADFSNVKLQVLSRPVL